MGILDKIRDTAIKIKRDDEQLYARALHEVESGVRRDGLFAKAIADAGTKGAEAQYLKLLVQKFRDERHVANRENETRNRLETNRHYAQLQWDANENARAQQQARANQDSNDQHWVNAEAMRTESLKQPVRNWALLLAFVASFGTAIYMRITLPNMSFSLALFLSYVGFLFPYFLVIYFFLRFVMLRRDSLGRLHYR
jgi:hypothetical protein